MDTHAIAQAPGREQLIEPRAEWDLHPQDALSRLIADIYDTTLGARRWPDVLRTLADFTGGQVAGLLSKDSVSKAGNAHYHHGIDEDYLRSYLGTYWQFDPLAPLLFFDVGQVVTATDQMTEREFRESRFYREWLRPQGWVDAANVVLDKSTTSCAILSVVRKDPHSPVDAKMRRRIGLVIPHVRRAVLIGRLIDLKSGEADAFSDILDGLTAGMFLLDGAGNIVHANLGGSAILSDGRVMSARAGRLVIRDGTAARELRTALDAAAHRPATSASSIPLFADEEPYVAHLLPLTSGARRRTGRHYSAVAALFVHPATKDVPAIPETIARTFGLTPSELRVLMAIVNVGGVPETAEALGVAETTVKTHLQRTFSKTGTSRQADLVRLVAGFSGPISR